jgi:hypothetical protein
MILTLLAAHQGEEFVIILPAIMLLGAFFILRWANQNDKDKDKDEDDTSETVPPEERPVGLVLPKLKTNQTEVEARQETSV